MLLILLSFLGIVSLMQTIVTLRLLQELRESQQAVSHDFRQVAAALTAFTVQLQTRPWLPHGPAGPVR